MLSSIIPELIPRQPDSTSSPDVRARFSFIVGMYKVLKTHFLNYTCSLHYTVLESLLNWLLSLIAVANWGISET